VRDFCSAADAGEGDFGLLLFGSRESLQQAAATLVGVPPYNPMAAGCLRADPMNRALSREDDGSAAAVADVSDPNPNPNTSPHLTLTQQYNDQSSTHHIMPHSQCIAVA